MCDRLHACMRGSPACCAVSCVHALVRYIRDEGCSKPCLKVSQHPKAHQCPKDFWGHSGCEAFWWGLWPPVVLRVFGGYAPHVLEGQPLLRETEKAPLRNGSERQLGCRTLCGTGIVVAIRVLSQRGAQFG